ncbi:HipA family kinase [Burkholderia stagnalis]|uniref:HipA family kinase n=1 Tax=Burkholderia stagnalis TaxID=1503054 RepID=UPI0009C00F0C
MPSLPIVKCDRTKAKPPSADAACIGIDTANATYYLCKDQTTTPWLPLSEWVTQQLARRCGIPVPSCAIVEVPTHPGQLLFGSVWEGGALDFSQINLPDVSNPGIFSAALTFDLLVHNDDRHLNNYLYLKLAGDLVCKIMDHSRCWWHSGWPLPPPPPGVTSNTMRAAAHWNAIINWDLTAKQNVLAAWRTITKNDVDAMIDSAPPAWINPTERKDFVDWWGTTDWSDRTDLVEGCLP